MSAKRQIERSEAARLAALSALTTMLGVAFLVLLVADAVQAAAAF